MGNNDFSAGAPPQTSVEVDGRSLVAHDLSKGEELSASFSVGAGELVAIVAEPQKSVTLFNCLAGFDSQLGGSITAGDTDVTALSPGERNTFRRRNTGLIYPAWNLISTLTVKENVAFGALASGLQPDGSTVAYLLELANLHETTAIEHLTRTDAILLASARAFALEPEFVIANHAADKLGREGGLRVTSYIKNASRQLGVPALFFTSAKALAEIADRTLYLDGGSVVSLVVPPAPSAFSGDSAETLGTPATDPQTEVDEDLLLAGTLDRIAPAKPLSEQQQAVLQRARDILDSLPGPVIEPDR